MAPVLLRTLPADPVITGDVRSGRLRLEAANGWVISEHSTLAAAAEAFAAYQEEVDVE